MDSSRSTPDACVREALVAYRAGDANAAHAALDRALALAPKDLRALLAKADLLAAQDLQREANVYYGAVLQVGGGATGLPPDLADGVARARAFRDRVVSGAGARLRESLDKAGYVEGRSDPRFTHALDLLTGRRTLYQPQPHGFYYPELPAHQFYPRTMFPWLDKVEAAVDAMTEELSALLYEDAGFAPYLRTAPGLPNRPDYPLVDSMDWSTCFLWKDGKETPNAARCPRTMEALADVPLCRVEGRSPYVMFSQLKAGAHIKPHTGGVNTRLICHVPLIVPPGCEFRVGNDVRQWERGKAWVFDDTIEHEARNTSDQTRVVLIFDIWRPELSEEERGLVKTLLETLDAFSPNRTAWE